MHRDTRPKQREGRTSRPAAAFITIRQPLGKAAVSPSKQRRTSLSGCASSVHHLRDSSRVSLGVAPSVSGTSVGGLPGQSMVWSAARRVLRVVHGFSRVPRYWVLGPESFAAAISRSRRLAPSVSARQRPLPSTAGLSLCGLRPFYNTPQKSQSPPMRTESLSRRRSTGLLLPLCAPLPARRSPFSSTYRGPRPVNSKDNVTEPGLFPQEIMLLNGRCSFI